MFLYTQTVLYCIQYANLSFKKYQSIFIKVNEFSASLAFLAKYLHYSQTINQEKVYLEMFEYHTYLHHSQTASSISSTYSVFEYHTYLHHSQTDLGGIIMEYKFEYHTYLHHSQTSTQMQ